ncbi:hypothetical protein GCM10027073_07190 [Streptomyces chlorus]
MSAAALRARGMAWHFHALLDAACERPDEPLSRLPILTEGEHMQVVHAWNRVEASTSTRQRAPACTIWSPRGP